MPSNSSFNESQKRKRTISFDDTIALIKLRESAPKHPRLHGALRDGRTIYTLHKIEDFDDDHYLEPVLTEEPANVYPPTSPIYSPVSPSYFSDDEK